MNKKQTSRMSLIAMCIVLIALFSACNESPRNTNNDAQDSYIERNEQRRLDDIAFQKARDSMQRNEDERKRKRDSTIQNIDVASLYIQRDSANANWAFKIQENGKVPLWAVYSYFQYLKVKDNISLYEIAAQIKKYFGIETNNIDTWGLSLKRMINKFAVSLNQSEKQMIIASLRRHSMLISSLNKLNTTDQKKLMSLLDTVVTYQDKSFEWVYTLHGSEVLNDEYNILKKVWDMPKLVKDTADKYYGYTYYLGDLNDIHNEKGWEKIWNTRYLNEYQYAIGIVHRRTLDAKNEKIYDVIRKVASLMNEAADQLSKQ